MEQKARAYLKRSIIITNISPDNVASEILKIFPEDLIKDNFKIIVKMLYLNKSLISRNKEYLINIHQLTQ